MNEIEPLLVELQRMPAELERAARLLGEEGARLAPADGGFCLLEQAWHLADLERDGYAERVRLLRDEDAPRLPDFDGEAVARERQYGTKSLGEGLVAFAAARAATLQMLRALDAAALARAGEQEGVGRITLADVPRMMAKHDASHRNEIAVLLALAGLSQQAPVSA